MSLLLLKKKIQEEFARLDKAKWKKYSEEGFSPDDIFEIVLQDQANWFLEQIDELEKEEPCKHYARFLDGSISYCDRKGDHDSRGHTFPIGTFRSPVWSGRSEKEIREQIQFQKNYCDWEGSIESVREKAQAIIKTLEWVLSKEKDEAIKK